MTGDSSEEKGRVLGIDLGTRRMGLAVSDPGRRIAQSLGVIQRKGLDRDLEKLGQVIQDQEATEIVLGLPLHLDGRESQGSRRSREFAAILEKELGMKVRLVDESLSTVEAEDILLQADLSRKKRKKVIDGLAAAIILRHT